MRLRGNIASLFLEMFLPAAKLLSVFRFCCSKIRPEYHEAGCMDFGIKNPTSVSLQSLW